jgi:hypothetical protein
MTSTNKDSQVRQLPTCGYMEETGAWSIDLELPRETLSITLNDMTRKKIQSSLDAFSGLCRAAEVRYESVRIGTDGSIDEGKEGKFVAEEGRRLQGDELISVLGSSEAWVFTTVFVTCDTLVALPPSGGIPPRLWFPRSSEFYLGYVTASEGPAPPQVTGCRIGFETWIDVWVQKTRAPSSWEWRDNRDYAVCNEPALEKALTKWELSAARPIIEWTSRHYKDQITRYGFELGT